MYMPYVAFKGLRWYLWAVQFFCSKQKIEIQLEERFKLLKLCRILLYVLQMRKAYKRTPRSISIFLKHLLCNTWKKPWKSPLGPKIQKLKCVYVCPNMVANIPSFLHRCGQGISLTNRVWGLPQCHCHLLGFICHKLRPYNQFLLNRLTNSL